MRKALLPRLALVAIGAITLSYAALAPGRPAAVGMHPVWSATDWPFPMDQWGPGEAFICRASDCGNEITVYLRPKIGFCNCTSGVADDEELERLADFDLFSNKQTAAAPGRKIEVGWMAGRSRAYRFAGSFRRQKTALTVALSDRCDVIVATAVSSDDHETELESLVMNFLNSDTVIRWAEKTLGL